MYEDLGPYPAQADDLSNFSSHSFSLIDVARDQELHLGWARRAVGPRQSSFVRKALKCLVDVYAYVCLCVFMCRR